MLKTTDVYDGEAIRFYHGGVAEIVKVKESEPDEGGGFLLDVYVRYVSNGSEETISNMHTSMLEKMLVS